jgi:hypothetical protein
MPKRQIPDGSKCIFAPFRRDFDISRITSSLVDVMTQECALIRRFGMIIELVFPLRLGPNTSIERSLPLDTSPNSLRPK